MKTDVCEQVVLVTEAGWGYGKAIALAFARLGCGMALTSRDGAALAEAAREIEDAGGKTLFMATADTGDPPGLDAAVREVLDKAGEVGILVNSIGDFERLETGDLSEEDWIALYSWSVLSALRATDLVLPGMRRKGWGRIINVDSDTGRGGGVRIPNASAIKAALHGLTRRLHEEGGGDGIQVSLLSPASMSTGLEEAMILGEARKYGNGTERRMASFLADLRAFVDVGRRHPPAEVAEAALLLASLKPSSLAGTSHKLEAGAIVSLP